MPSVQRERLDELGRRQGKSLAELVRQAVDKYLGLFSCAPGTGSTSLSFPG